mmetsp:Transcript_21308/g.34100  ORF Transcript_21308/g.34100 Transcript_21308/m.34100 type:complete len:212 (-) Transcript_21308:623-1258(-)
MKQLRPSKFQQAVVRRINILKCQYCLACVEALFILHQLGIVVICGRTQVPAAEEGPQILARRFTMQIHQVQPPSRWQHLFDEIIEVYYARTHAVAVERSKSSEARGFAAEFNSTLAREPSVGALVQRNPFLEGFLGVIIVVIHLFRMHPHPLQHHIFCAAPRQSFHSELVRRNLLAGLRWRVNRSWQSGRFGHSWTWLWHMHVEKLCLRAI